MRKAGRQRMKDDGRVETGMARRAGRSGDCDLRAKGDARVSDKLELSCWTSRGVRTDQCQLKPLSRDRCDAGKVAPAQFEPIAGIFDWNGFPPRSPRAVIFGQYQLTDVD